MKTPKNFEYDLWTTVEDSQIKYFVRIKKTAEISEVDLETMRFLRNEEKKLRRSMHKKSIKVKGNSEVCTHELEVSILSLNTGCITKKDKEFFIDKTNYEELVITNICKQTLLENLTLQQFQILNKLISEELPCLEIAKQLNLNESTVRWHRNNIKEIAKNII